MRLQVSGRPSSSQPWSAGPQPARVWHVGERCEARYKAQSAVATAEAWLRRTALLGDEGYAGVVVKAPTVGLRRALRRWRL